MAMGVEEVEGLGVEEVVEEELEVEAAEGGGIEVSRGLVEAMKMPGKDSTRFISWRLQ